MKPLFVPVIFCIILSACKSNSDPSRLPGNLVNNPASMNNTPKGDFPIISFDTLEYNFGKITEGDVVSHNFNFRNIGTANLVITDVRASCGCTSPSWPKEIIKKNGSNTIIIKYDSEGREGKFNKGITVYSNAYPNNTTIKITGEVIPNNF